MRLVDLTMFWVWSNITQLNKNVVNYVVGQK
nr:MAG TPA: hypothetical protein [Caudoviricetes sp.]